MAYLHKVSINKQLVVFDVFTVLLGKQVLIDPVLAAFASLENLDVLKTRFKSVCGMAQSSTR